MTFILCLSQAMNRAKAHRIERDDDPEDELADVALDSDDNSVPSPAPTRGRGRGGRGRGGRGRGRGEGRRFTVYLLRALTMLTT